MTLVAAWTRKTGSGRELWVMSDSRLSGGKIWDYGPKIFGIGRSDAVIAFAGDTAWSYPLIAQITSYIESFINLRERALDISEAYERILQLLNESLQFVSQAADPSLKNPECSFLLAGYSARKKAFFIRRIIFSFSRKKFEGRQPRKMGLESVAFIGDVRPVNAIIRRVSEALKPSTGSRIKRLDMAPAEAFFKILTSKRFSEIGGAPQVSKVYEHMSQRHIGVYWPPDVDVEDQDIFLRGRRLRKHDVLDHPWVYDPSAAKLYWHDFSPDKMRSDFLKKQATKNTKTVASTDET